MQTVSDYPLVEAIHQNVVKHPVLPDAASRAKLDEKKSSIFTEKYADYLRLGVEEWKKSYADHQPLGKKAVLFVMVDDTRNCDEVGEWLEKNSPELQGGVLVIHTKTNGEISEAASGKNKEELEKLRKQSNEIDSWNSPFKAIVSVLMLKEGWDVRNVTVICGLRAYAAKSNILPEQTLGRGLRRMHFGSDAIRETVSVMGTPAFMEFVESIQSEGVSFEHVPMSAGGQRQDSLIVEVDSENPDKDLDALDIPLPKLSRRYNREFKDLAALDPSALGNPVLPLKPFTDEEIRLTPVAMWTTSIRGQTPMKRRWRRLSVHCLATSCSRLGIATSFVATPQSSLSGAEPISTCSSASTITMWVRRRT